MATYRKEGKAMKHNPAFEAWAMGRSGLPLAKQTLGAYKSRITRNALYVYEQRQIEIDALKALLDKANANMEEMERSLYLKINELETEIDSLKEKS
jgi:hypothetical protein